MSFFISNVEGELGLTTAGYAALVILLIAALLGAAALTRHQETSERSPMSTKKLVFCAMAVALAMVTSMLKLYSFPFGGSVTLFSMLFICLTGYFYGPATGILTGAAYGILQLIIEPYIYFPLQVLVDYPLAFGALGLAGCFSNSRFGLIKGYLLGIVGRYFFAVLSGWIFFGEYAWEGWSALPYSLAYNGAYIFTEGVITVIILLIPAVSKSLTQIKVMANN
ncbi:MAG: energy-coupled thiamine transporter ThiT [Eubacteriales bacterium]|nr:energy-coupled thiamine transporter ThiT [Eubacteriales bacterium]